MNEYLVIRKEQVQKECIACRGTGHVKIGNKQCSYCGGKGHTIVYHTTEVPLKIALPELLYGFKTDQKQVVPNASLIDKVIGTVSDYYQIPAETLFDHRRDREIVELRYMLFRFLRTEFRFTYNDIGKKLGGFDHATVRRGRYEVEKWAETDKIFASKFNEFNILVSSKIMKNESNSEI